MTDEEKEQGLPEKQGTDYTKAAEKRRQPGDRQKKKEVAKVVKEPVKEHKRGVVSKIKDLFVAADFRTVLQYVGYEVLIPAARNMVVDTATKGVERMMYGEARRRSIGQGSRMTYQSPINRSRDDWRDPRTRPPSGTQFPRHDRKDYILQSKGDADSVLEEMYNLLSMYEVVSVADLKDMVGFPTSHIDNKWGWVDLSGTEIRQVREGWLIDLPREEPI